MLAEDTGPGLSLLTEGAIALGLGLVIGIEREHRHVDEKDKPEPILGVRSFALLSLTGWLSALLADRWPWLPPLLLALTGAMVLAKYLRETQGGQHLGITTEIAALLTVVYGLLVHHDTLLAVALALVTTVVLISKPWVRVVVPQLLRTELLGTLQFLILVLIVLPLLPKEPVDPWGVLPPRSIGKFVVLVAGVGFVGYVLTRLLGDKRAAALTGVVGGLVSSTAVTAGMAQRVGREAKAAPTAAVSTLAANAIVAPRVVIVAAIAAPQVALTLLAPLGAYFMVLIVGTVLAMRAAAKAPSVPPHADDPQVRNPFALLPALKWGALLCAVMLIAHLLQRWLGDAGLLLTGAVAGLTDVDAVTLAGTQQVQAGTLGASTAELAILVAVASNTVVKVVAARAGGGPAFGRAVGLPLAAAVGLGLLVAIVV